MNIKRATKTVAAVSIIILIVYLLGGCASLFKGSHTMVDFSSDPEGAKVYVNGALRGTTPINLKLESKRTYTIEFKKDGFEPRTYTITNSVGAGWIVLDVLFGLVGVVIDAATGAWYELDQDMVNAILEKQQ